MFTKPTFRRPTPSMAVAITALVVASTGTSYAAATMSGELLKKRSVPASRVVNDTLTGKQINEAKLGQVPSAKSADTAKTATSAGSATTAQSAGNADQLQGRPAAAFMAGATRLVTDQSVPVSGAGGGSGLSMKAFCDPSERAISGGGGWYVPGTDVHTALHAPVTATTPILQSGEMIGWEVSGRNLAGTDRFLRVYAICVPKSA